MNSKALLVIVLALEWVTLTTLLAPRLAAARQRLGRHPQAALALWFGLLLTAGLAIATALIMATYLAFRSWMQLNQQALGTTGWLAAVAASFAPWLLLALGGITLALVSRTFEPLLDSARQVRQMLDLAAIPLLTFHGVPVLQMQTPTLVAFTRGSGRGAVIVVSSGLQQALDTDEYQAVLWHEHAHARLGHGRLKSLAHAVLAVSPWLLASRALANQADWFCELAADTYAAKRVGRSVLLSARNKVQLG